MIGFVCRLAAIHLALLTVVCAQCSAQFFVQTNLTSDVPALAANLDPNLKNPWGISFSPTSPFWVSNEVTGNSTIYNGTGVPQALVVTIPFGHPTGQVFNSTTDFAPLFGNPAVFLFATKTGRIAAWDPSLGTSAAVRVDSSGAGAEYTGLALGNNGSENLLYAANSASGGIDVFNGTFGPGFLGGNFTDPNLPAGFTPYNIVNVNGALFVTYENEAIGGGIVDRFDFNGNLLGRFSTGGPLASPWGVVQAPAGFGPFGGAILIGNEDDGRINAFNPTTGAFLGTLLDKNGNPIANTGLWGLAFGNGNPTFDPSSLYFTAGINNEADGLFGRISPLQGPGGAVPEPGGWTLGAAILVSVAALRRRKSRGRTDGVSRPRR